MTILDQLKVPESSINSVMEQIAEQGFRMRNPVIPIFDAIKERVEKFQASLDDKHEVAVMLASFGSEVTIMAEKISYSAPNVIIFDGAATTGERIQLIQHVSQLNFLLKALPIQSEQPRRIGFILE